MIGAVELDVRDASATAGTVDVRARITRYLVLEIFLIFFQGFMVAPLVPRLAHTFGTDIERAGTLVPAYALPFGIVCLVVGPLADRYGRANVLRYLLGAAIVVPVLTVTAATFGGLFGWRIVAGVALGGIAPITLAMVAEMYPYAERGRPVGWIFGAIAGGMAIGATAGPWLEPSIGWRGLFLVVGVANVVVVAPLARAVALRPSAWTRGPSTRPRDIARAYAALVRTRRGATVYGYVFLNGVFHSGVFSWLGVFFIERYHLAPRELGFALLGYGIPGFLLGPVVGRLADRFGRRWLIRGGFVLAGVCALVLAAPLPALAATVTITALSFGFDLSHPLLAGIVTSLDPVRTAQAMALNTFTIFIGLGVGSLVFGVLRAAIGFSPAFVCFGIFQLAIATASLVLFDRSWR
ncbi:MAG TPA: MFS transporter [Kofleriaceae bacterium]|jgi:predicted MFS family arabinose efflux permease